MNEDSALSFLQRQFDFARTARQGVPTATDVQWLHEVLSMRLQELSQLQTEIECGNDISPTLSETFNSVSEAGVLDEASTRPFMSTQARRAFPWLRELRAHMEADCNAKTGGYESAIEIVKRMIHEPTTRDFALQVAKALESSDVQVLAGKRWIYSVFPDGCTAFYLACPRNSPTDNWATYSLIDLNEAGGQISPIANLFDDPRGRLEAIAFLVSVFERHHWHPLKDD